jgi:hypothetical protein
MRALLKAIFFILLMASMAACASTRYNDSNSNDNSSSDPQVRYGGQMTVRGQASKGTNQ